MPARAKRQRKSKSTQISDMVIKSMEKRNITYRSLPIGLNITPGDAIHRMTLPCATFLTTVTAGAYASTFTCTASNLVYNWASRIAPLFKEYCIIHIRFRVRSVVNGGAGGGGIWQTWLTESDSATPNLADCLDNRTISIPAAISNPNDQIFEMDWTLASPNEGIWYPTSTSNFTVANLKTFANVANFGFSSGDNSSRLFYEPYCTILFRGYTAT